MIERIKRAYRAHGLGGLAKQLLGRGRTLYLKEEHVWYELALDGYEPKVAIPEGVELVKATEAELPQAAVTGKDPELARTWMGEGHDLWLMVEGSKAAFSCWIYRGRTPTLAAKGGWLELPEGVVCLEDSATNPEFRGRGIAPAAWSAMATTLQAEGLRQIVTKVGTENAPSRKAVLKAGFVETGVMSLTRIGPFRRARVENPSGVTGPLLAATLEG